MKRLLALDGADSGVVGHGGGAGFGVRPDSGDPRLWHDGPRAVPRVRSGISVGLVIAGLGNPDVIIAGIVYISIADWRRSAPPATNADEPTPLLRDRSDAGEQHRAA